MQREHRHVSIDSYAYLSGMRDWNSGYKVLFSAAALMVVLAADRPAVSLGTFFYMLLLTVGKGGVRLHDYICLLGIPATFILLGGLAVALEFSGEVPGGTLASLRLGGVFVCVTERGLSLAVTLGLKALGAVSAVFMMTLSTPMGEILAVLRRLHIPALMIELMHLIYRYIFLLFDISERQREAAYARLGYRDFKTSLRTFGSTLANLLLLSMKRSELYYDALEARGYDGGCRFWEERKRLTAGQLWYGALYAAMAALLIGGL